MSNENPPVLAQARISDDISPHNSTTSPKIVDRDETVKKDSSHVAILLCTFNGERFLGEQLKSISEQLHDNFSLWISDDGSNDNTVELLRQFQSEWGSRHFSIERGPKNGYAANFLSLACRKAIDADFFAFADQDDVWERDKLSRALNYLQTIDSTTPALYCARTRLIDERGKECGFSPLYKRPPGFGNSLVQSLASGNTMVMNKAARNLLCRAGQLDIVSHDWWLYSLVTGAGGKVIYDRSPTVRYRQHGQNVLGASPGLRATHKRISLLMQGRFQNWNATNTLALNKARELLTPANAAMLDHFSKARTRWLLPRATGVWRSKVYRQTFIGDLGLTTAILFNKI